MVAALVEDGPFNDVTIEDVPSSEALINGNLINGNPVNNLVNDVQVSTATELCGGCSQDGAHGLGGAPFLANHLADVPLGHAQLEQRVLIAVDLTHLNAVGVIDQGLGNGADEFLEWHAT